MSRGAAKSCQVCFMPAQLIGSLVALHVFWSSASAQVLHCPCPFSVGPTRPHVPGSSSTVSALQDWAHVAFVHLDQFPPPSHDEIKPASLLPGPGLGPIPPSCLIKPMLPLFVQISTTIPHKSRLGRTHPDGVCTAPTGPWVRPFCPNAPGLILCCPHLAL